VLRSLKLLVPEAVSSKVLAASAGVGLIVGLLVALFEYLTLEVVFHQVAGWPFYVQAASPFVGLVVARLLLVHLGGGASPATSEDYVTQFHSRHPRFRFREVPARMLAGTATIGLGGALGLEGPSIYLGSAIGHYIYEPLERHLGRGAAQQLLTAGAAAGVAAVFQTPATGVVFALESPYRDDVAHRALLPCLIASAVSYLTFVTMPFIAQEPVVGFTTDRTIEPGELIGAVALGVGAGLGGRLFAWFTRQAKSMSKVVPPSIAILVGGIILGGLALASREVFGAPLTLGPGLSVFEWFDGESSTLLLVALFAFRASATLTTIGAGGVGGLFIPLAVQGVLLGRIVGDGLDLIGLGELEDVRLWPILGLAAFLAAGYRTPIAAVMFVAESTGGQAVVPALIAAAFSQLVAGAASVSLAQKEERLGGLESRLTLPVAAALDTDVLTVPPDASINEFVWIHALGQRQPVVPVVDGSTYLGLVSIHDATSVDRSTWEETMVTKILDTHSPTGQPSWSIRDAVAAMSRSDSDLLVVTDADGGFVGLVRESEIVKLDAILVETESSESDGDRR
jgi:CIC family chloride channel protein